MTGGLSHRSDASTTGLAALGLVAGMLAMRLAWRAVASLMRHPARHERFPLATLAVIFAAFALSACGLLPVQTPAPIVEHSYIPTPDETESTEPEEPAPVAAVPEPASTPKPAPAPKPKRRIVKPKPPEPVIVQPQEAPEPPPPPPPIISTRILQHDQLHGLLDAEVQRADGKVVGRAVDLYIDTAAKPKLMMVNLAGFLGVGDRKVNFPWTAFRFAPNSKTAPITFVPPAPAVKGKPADPAPKPQPVAEAPPSYLQLVDSTVTQKTGARIGRVVDVLVDSQGEPEALVLDLSNSLAEDKRHVAANWGDLHVVTRNKQASLQMDFTEPQLKASPTYSPEQPIKIVSPVVAAPAAPVSSPAAAASAGAPASNSSTGTTASGSVAAQSSASSGARPNK
ncbi:PRC-barrel domain-containing protein [Caballeronia sp. GAWG2-1]|uniref:PRC-barrel domain-containing protein n=1 Tax=Caballeronia sp. GAWG2-1 TaxID=2921744 RepID=UPI002029289B|nr:PRC-barrel domain-containing protein [Caballeronia sp. GAWG2-1]